MEGRAPRALLRCRTGARLLGVAELRPPYSSASIERAPGPSLPGFARVLRRRGSGGSRFALLDQHQVTNVDQ
jgi:hypothetical protein